MPIPGIACGAILKRTRVSTLISRLAGATIGDLTAGGGLAAAFDGSTTQVRTSSASKGVSASGYNNTVGKDWGAGVTKTINRWITYGTSDEGFCAAGATGVKLQGSNDNTNWTDLDSFTSSAGAGGVYDRSGAVDISTAYRYHRVNFNGNGANSGGVAEVAWYELI